MATQVISQRYGSNSGMFQDDSDWEDKYLGHRVSFVLNGYKMTGKVTGSERCFLANGIHDILEIELEHERKQVKIQMHRQAVTVLD